MFPFNTSSIPITLQSPKGRGQRIFYLTGEVRNTCMLVVLWGRNCPSSEYRECDLDIFEVEMCEEGGRMHWTEERWQTNLFFSIF